MLEQVKAVLFDLDGTLVDSMWMWKDIDIEYLGQYGYELPPELQKDIEGMSFSETAVYFKELFHLPKSLEEIKTDWIRMAKEKYAHEVPMKPGALSFLKYLKAHRIRSGIATSNSRELLDAVTASLKLDRYIDCFMTSCEAGAGKPAPDIYLKVAARLGASPEECLVFEDTPAGIQAGINAGIRVCAVEDRYVEEQKGTICRLADYYIQDFGQVLDGTYRELRPGLRRRDAERQNGGRAVLQK